MTRGRWVFDILDRTHSFTLLGDTPVYLGWWRRTEVWTCSESSFSMSLSNVRMYPGRVTGLSPSGHSPSKDGPTTGRHPSYFRESTSSRLGPVPLSSTVPVQYTVGVEGTLKERSPCLRLWVSGRGLLPGKFPFGWGRWNDRRRGGPGRDTVPHYGPVLGSRSGPTLVFPLSSRLRLPLLPGTSGTTGTTRTPSSRVECLRPG